jgi:hypothetical protein
MCRGTEESNARAGNLNKKLPSTAALQTLARHRRFQRRLRLGVRQQSAAMNSTKSVVHAIWQPRRLPYNSLGL